MALHRMCLLITTAFLIATSSGASVKSTANDRLERYTALLTEYFAVPRHPYLNEANWKRARAGIIEEFQKIVYNVPNVTLETQPFETEIRFTPSFPSLITGENIVVTFMGRHVGTDRDQILLIGAHYESDGAPLLSLDDNGSGVVAMLEVARGLADAIVNRKAVLLNTMIFVAFDIQQFEHEHAGSSKYSSGSQFFVHEKLTPILNAEPKPSFLGAIILDSVMNYNGSDGSQLLPDGFQTSFPDAGTYIEENNFTGNYLAMVTKERLRSLVLDYSLAEQWNSTNAAKEYPLLTLEIRRAAASMAAFEFLKHDHVTFWNHQPNPLPAVLLTDTSKWRGIQRKCEITICNTTHFITQERLELLDQVVVTLDKFVSKSQLDGNVAIDTTGGASGITSELSIIASMLTVLVTIVLHNFD